MIIFAAVASLLFSSSLALSTAGIGTGRHLVEKAGISPRPSPPRFPPEVIYKNIIFTSGMMVPDTEAFVPFERGLYVAYVLKAADFNSDEYLKKVFVLDESDRRDANSSIYAIASLPRNANGSMAYHELTLNIDHYAKIVNTNPVGTSTPDPFILYIENLTRKPCDVFAITDFVNKKLVAREPGRDESCVSSLLLSAEPSFELTNFAFQGPFIKVFLATSIHEDSKSLVFSMKDPRMAAKSRVLIAGPIATVTADSGMPFECYVKLNAVYNGTLEQGSAVSVSSASYGHGEYALLYPREIIPDNVCFTTKHMAVMETNLHGYLRFPSITALELDYIGGVTKQYTDTFEDQFTAGGKGVEIKKKDKFTTFTVQISYL